MATNRKIMFIITTYAMNQGKFWKKWDFEISLNLISYPYPS